MTYNQPGEMPAYTEQRACTSSKTHATQHSMRAICLARQTDVGTVCEPQPACTGERCSSGAWVDTKSATENENICMHKRSCTLSTSNTEDTPGEKCTL